MEFALVHVLRTNLNLSEEADVPDCRRRRAWVQIAAATLSGNSVRQTVHAHRASGEKYWQPTAGFMTHVTCRQAAKNRDKLRNPTLGNRVWATFTVFNPKSKPNTKCYQGKDRCSGADVRWGAKVQSLSLHCYSLIICWMDNRLKAIWHAN